MPTPHGLSRSALLLIVLLAACGEAPVAGAPACRTDADCVKATCCHATACIVRDAAPDCAGVACTMECRPGTLDCGGSCACDGGSCIARVPSPPAADALPAR